MVINIDESIIQYIKENNGNINCSDKVIVAINSIIKSFAIKQHIVFGDLEILEYLSESELIETLNKNALLWLIQRYSTIGLFIKQTDERVIVYKDKTKDYIYCWGKEYFVPVEKFINIRCTQLLTENDKDADFFVDIANEINRKVLHFDNIDIEYDGRSYSGGNIETVAAEVVRKFNISLCIADSDKDYEDDKNGSTLSKVSEVVKKYKDNNIISLLPLKVREKENLIPPLFYIIKLSHSKNFLELLNQNLDNEELIRFLDIKDGLKAKKYNNKNPKWHKLYDGFLEECEEKKILNCSITELPSKDKDYIFLTGINGNSIDEVEKYFFRGGVIDRVSEMENLDNVPENALDNEKNNLQLSKKIFENLPNYLKNDWIEIGKKIIHWCCRISDEEMSVFY